MAASLDREPWARVIKVSDFTDNGVGVIHAVGPKWLITGSPLWLSWDAFAAGAQDGEFDLD